MFNKKTVEVIVISFICISIFLSTAISQTSYDYDIIIKGGKVLDGSLKKEFKADVAIIDGLIVKVGKSIKGNAKDIIDAKGLFITPGFIDLHTHVDRGMFYLENQACLNYLTQGVTTVIAGQCGTSAWPLFDKARDQIGRWEKNGIGPNAVMLVGHGSVRRLVMGIENREPTKEELNEMKKLVREAMEQGASGFSTGLIYVPGKFSKTDELIELVKEIAPYKGIYHTHIRNEWENILTAVKEAIEIGEKTGVPVHISHYKVMGTKNWGNIDKASELIEEARSRGMKITADQYPYRYTNGYPYMNLIPRSAWVGTNSEKLIKSQEIEDIFDYLRDSDLKTLYKKISADPLVSDNVDNYLDELPRKELVGLVSRTVASVSNFRGFSNPRERVLFLESMKDPLKAERIRRAVNNYLNNPVSAESIIIAICQDRALEGKSIVEAAAIKGKSLEDTAIELALMGTLAVPLRMCEEDIEFAMKKDWVATGSDGTAPFFGVGLTHSRSYSTFLHKIKKYVLERKAISLPQAIRSQTSLAAEIMNMKDRGWIKEGFKADVVILDLKNIKTLTSISNPNAYCEGVKYLLINGRIVIKNSEFTGELPGEILKLKQK